MIVFFLSFIGGLGLLHILAEDQSFSEIENRVLSKFPKPTFKSIISGDFTSDFEQYISDQFVWKKFWIGVKSDAERLTLKQENNGVFIGKDEYLLEGYEGPGEQFQRNLKSIQYFLDKTKDIHSYLLLAPTAVEIYHDKLPLFVDNHSQKETYEIAKNQFASSIKLIDVYEHLKNKRNEPIYFRTDHHWTMRGAYYAYEIAANEMGLIPYRIDDFHIEIVSDDFYGTLYSKANAYRIKADKIEVFQPKFDVTYEVEYEEGKIRKNNLYEWAYLNKKDKYSLFLDGNHPQLKIKSTIDNGRKLAVLKDSYAHSFIPFLANHFEEVHVIDLRYYHNNMYEYLEDNEISDVLFLYNQPNFEKDSNLIWLQY